MEIIVVGVDGSKEAVDALTHAAHEAAAHGSRLRIVCAWDIPLGSSVGSLALKGSKPAVDILRDDAEAIVREAVAAVNEMQPSVPCDGRALQGKPADVLVGQAVDASLLIVGSRGRGRVAGLLLGSTSQRVAEHAPCPVLVVRNPKD